MISTKKEQMTPQLRKEKVAKLREEHQPYFDGINIPDAVFIPKMAYRPSGKDELHITFFPSELERECDIYTQFVSIDYDIEDPKKTLYLHKHNPHWREEYETTESSTGFIRHMVPVPELKIINNIDSRNIKEEIVDLTESISQKLIDDIPNPDEIFSHRAAIEALVSIAETLKKIEQKLK